MVRLTCEHCGTGYERERGREGRGRFCSIRCSSLAQPRRSKAERFWEKVDRSGECWVWTGDRDRWGYGRLWTHVDGKPTYEFAHRLSLEMVGSPVPAGLYALHTCDNPPCVNPEHLYAGTILDNNTDRESRGRRIAPRGEDHASALLTEWQVRDIRARYPHAASASALASEHGVSRSLIRAVASRRLWKHVV